MGKQKKIERTLEDAVNEGTNQLCDNCGLPDIISDNTRGQLVCGSCGLVAEDRTISIEQDWRAYNAEEGKNRARAEPLFNSPLSGVPSSIISEADFDASGKKLPYLKFRKLRLINKRTKKSQRSINTGLSEIKRICSQLELPNNIMRSAISFLNHSLNTDLINSYSSLNIAAASIYAAIRLARFPRTLDEIANISDIPTKKQALNVAFRGMQYLVNDESYYGWDEESSGIIRYSPSKKKLVNVYNELVKTLNIRIPMQKAEDYLFRFSTQLGLSGEYITTAKEILDDIYSQKLHLGKNPIGIAAVAIYLSSIINDVSIDSRLTQTSVAKVIGVSEITLRSNLKRLVKKMPEKYCTGFK